MPCKYPLAPDESADIPPAQRLRAFIHHLMFSLLADGVPSWLGQLMAQEMIEPTVAQGGGWWNADTQMVGK